ncbi:MAG: DNA primase [Clostridiaceae bacterium]|nr:DNA primase [Clostridiaceae bacterium]
MAAERGIPQSIVDEIKNRNDIVAVVEQYVRLSKRSAANLFGLCPFHSENTPSFSVAPEKQIYYCFGCHKGGDVIHFIMDIEKVGYLDALRLLADRAGVHIPEPEDAGYRKRAERETLLYKINAAAAAHFYLNLTESPKGKAASAYLARRGITGGTIRKFGLGFAADDWEDLWKRLRNKGFDAEVLSGSGLFRQGRDGPYDLFRNRIMFPIFDALGRVVAFGGRVMDDSQPKYINSPESAVYTKGRHLYALNFAKKSKEGSLIIVEGYMDAIAMHQAGVENAVAALGTALTTSQAQLARRYTENVIVGFDADASGQEAALRSLDILVSKGCHVTVLQIPDGKDPDEYIRRNGADRFHDLVKRALPLMDYKLLSVERKSTRDGDLDILDYQDVACKVLAAEPNPIIRELYAAKVADKLGVPSEAVVREIERRRKGVEQAAGQGTLRDRLAQRQTGEPQEPAKPFPEDPLFLLCLIASSPELADRMRISPEPEDFPEGVIRDMAVAVLARDERAGAGLSGLIGLAGDADWHGRRIADEAARMSFEIDAMGDLSAIEEAANSYLSRVRKDRLVARKAAIVAWIAAGGEGADKMEMKEELLDIDVQLRQFRG